MKFSLSRFMGIPCILNPLELRPSHARIVVYINPERKAGPLEVTQLSTLAMADQFEMDLRQINAEYKLWWP